MAFEIEGGDKFLVLALDLFVGLVGAGHCAHDPVEEQKSSVKH